MSKIIFQYNNVDIPQLIIKNVTKDKVIVLGLLEFKKSDLNDNLPIFDEIVVALDQFLTRKGIKRDEVLFVVNAIESTKITTILPKVSDRKAKKIYDTELTLKIPNLEDYDCLSVASENNDNKIVYEYLVNTKYRKYFEKLGEKLHFRNIEVDYMNSYLFSETTSYLDEDTYAYIYVENKVAYLLVVINGELCGYSSFANTDMNYHINIVSTIDKHIFDLEKVDIKQLYTNKEIPCLEGLKPIVKPYILGGEFND